MDEKTKEEMKGFYESLSDEERTEFSDYIANRFEGAEEIPDPDESFLKIWDSIIRYAGQNGVVDAINTKICPKRPVEFHSPDEVGLEMFSSFAGRIPIIYVRDPDDFERLVTNVAYKGIRPEGLETTGASFIHGTFTRLIILSAKPYSNVPAAELGLEESDWMEKSLILRRGHECAHYFTKQTYGITNNILHDEIMADFIGMYEAFGFYRAEWFLRFMGIDGGDSGRMIFYTKELSANIRKAVYDLIKEAAYGLEQWSKTDKFATMTVSERIKRMCHEGLQGMKKI